MDNQATKYVSVSTAARILGREPSTVRYWCQKGYIKAITSPGGVYSIPRAELDGIPKRSEVA